MDNFNFIKIKNVCSAEDIGKRIKKIRHTHWERTFTNHISHRQLVFMIYEELSKAKNNKTAPKNKGNYIVGTIWYSFGKENNKKTKK